MQMSRARFITMIASQGAGVSPISYLFRDLFTTPAAAGAVNGTAAEPGVGIRNVTDVDNTRVSISSSRVNIKGNSAWMTGVLCEDTALTRAMGAAVFFRFIAPASSSGAFGLSNVKTKMYNATSAEYAAPTPPQIFPFWGRGPLLTATSEYEIAIVCRPKGLHYLIRGGTEYPEWSHIYSTFGDTTASLYFVAEAYHDNFWIYKDIRFIQLGAPFAADYAIATARNATANISDIITHEADGHIELTWQAVTGQTLNILFRRVDDDNCWKLECAQAGTIKLFKREAGTDTEYASGKTQTWTNGTSYRIILRFWGQHVVTEVAGTQKHDYTSAAFNLTATTAKTDRAGTNFIAWPWTLSGAALAEVVRVSGPF